MCLVFDCRLWFLLFLLVAIFPGASPGGAVLPVPPHLKSVPPHFTFGPPVVAHIQYGILKMLAPLLLNPGDWPASFPSLIFLFFAFFA